MKLAGMFSAAGRQRELSLGGNGTDMLLPTFKNMAFHQCPSLMGMLAQPSSWPWGKHVFIAATKFWTETKLWKSLEATNIVELYGDGPDWTCFDDIFFNPTYGWYTPGPKLHASWVAALREEMITKSPKSLQDSSVPVRASMRAHQPGRGKQPLQMHFMMPKKLRLNAWARAHEREAAASFKKRCAVGSLRIVVFQRTQGTALRRFRNLDAVRAMLAEHTSHPVDVVTVTASTPVQDQARLFADGFDLLVAPHGSHLANMVLCDPARTAIIEVVPSVFEVSWHHNAQKMGFRSYITSTGHRALCDKCNAYSSNNCTHEADTGRLTCADRHVRITLLQHDMEVNVSTLRREVVRSLTALCGATL